MCLKHFLNGFWGVVGHIVLRKRPLPSGIAIATRGCTWSVVVFSLIVTSTEFFPFEGISVAHNLLYIDLFLSCFGLKT